MAAKKSALPGIRPSRVRLLSFLVPLLGIDFVAVAKNRAGEFLLGLAALYAAAFIAAMAAFTVGWVLRGRVVYTRVGIGPVIKRSVVGDRLVVWRALPIAVGGLILPRPARYGRDWRLINVAGVGTYIVLIVPGAMLLPLYGALTFCWSVGIVLGVSLSARDPLSGRVNFARVFTRATPQTDPVLTEPRRTLAERAVVDAQFGDFIAAERTLAELRATSSGDPDGAVALLESEILTARGDFAAALRVQVPLPADAALALATASAVRNHARTAKLLLLAAEQSSERSAQTLQMAWNQLKALAATPHRDGSDRAGRALYALQAGNATAAVREARICLIRARTPLTTADALCALAIANSMQGKAKAARTRLDQAARLVPWYPRLTTVQRIIATRAGTAVLPPVNASADTSSVFDDPWSAPSRD